MFDLEKYKKTEKEKAKKTTAFVVGTGIGGASYLISQHFFNSLLLGAGVGVTAYFAYSKGIFENKFEQFAITQKNEKEKELRIELYQNIISIIKTQRNEQKLETNENDLKKELEILSFDDLNILLYTLKREIFIRDIEKNKKLINILKY